MILIILLDVGKHKWRMNQQQLGKMRWYVHWITGLANCGIILQFLILYFIDKNKDQNDTLSDHQKVMILYSINIFLICFVSLLQWWHFRYRIKSVEFHKTKLFLIFAILFFAYLIRVILNQSTTIQTTVLCYNVPHPWAW